MLTPTRAVAGDTITIPERGDFVLKPSCGVSNGQWYCVTHSVGFAHNSDYDSHIKRGAHRLAWICFDHGPEAP